MLVLVLVLLFLLLLLLLMLIVMNLNHDGLVNTCDRVFRVLSVAD